MSARMPERPGWLSARSSGRSPPCPEEQRAVLLLVTIDGVAYREAADILEILIGTV